MKTDNTHLKSQAEDIIQQYALTSPIRVFELADLLGIGWKLCKRDEFCDMILQSEKDMKMEDLQQMVDDVLGFYDIRQKVLYLHDVNQPITRKRFTMAHEIGHYILHSDSDHKRHYRKTFYRSDILKPSAKPEIEANYFAGYLLVPDKDLLSVLPYSRMMVSGEQIVDKYSKIFAVSPESMRIRLRTFKNENQETWQKYDLDQKLF